MAGLENKGQFYTQKAILKQLQELTKNIRLIRNKVDKIEKKLEKLNSAK